MMRGAKDLGNSVDSFSRSWFENTYVRMIVENVLVGDEKKSARRQSNFEFVRGDPPSLIRITLFNANAYLYFILEE